MSKAVVTGAGQLDELGGKPKRILDYIVVCGEDDMAALEPSKMHTRHNSKVLKELNDLLVVYAKADAPPNYELVRNAQNQPADLNTGSMGGEIYLCVSRAAHAHRAHISSIAAIFVDKAEQPPTGHEVLPYNVNKGSFGRKIHLCVERDPDRAPLTDLVVIDHSKGERPPPGFKMVNKNLNMGSFGHELYLCYKRAPVARKDTYSPRILSRFPQEDHPDNPLQSDGIPMLCFPQGMALQREYQLPSFFSFVITGAKGEEVYCYVLTFYEQIQRSSNRPSSATASSPNSGTNSATDSATKQAEQADVGSTVQLPGSVSTDSALNTKVTNVSADSKDKSAQEETFFVPKCICLISHWAFYDAYQAFLKDLYQISLSPSPFPLEQILAHFLENVPLPAAGGPAVHYKLGLYTIQFTRHSHYFLPMKDFSFRPLFECLDIPNILDLFCHVIAERKIILYSNTYSLLTPVAEALRTIMFPFQWQFAFIPVLPSNLSYVLRAPVPLIVGMHRSFLDEVRVSGEVVLVDLDRNRIHIPEKELHQEILSDAYSRHLSRAEHSTVRLPEGLRHDLIEQLQSCANIFKDRDTSSESPSLYVNRQARHLSTQHLASNAGASPSEDEEDTEVFDERETQDVFLRLFVFLLQDYRDYLLPIGATDSATFKIPFDTEAFLSSFPDDLVAFMSQITHTQAFATFVIDRTLPCHDLARFKQLTFFDWCIAIECAQNLDPNYYIRLEDLLTGKLTKPLEIEQLTVGSGHNTSGAHRYEVFPRLDVKLFKLKPDSPWHITPVDPKEEALARTREKQRRRLDPVLRMEETIARKIEEVVGTLVDMVRQLRRRARAKRRERAREAERAGGKRAGGLIVDDEVFVDGNRWNKNQLLSIYELWVDVFLLDPVRSDVCRARKDLLQTLLVMGNMLAQEVTPSARMFLTLCSFCTANELFVEFQLLYRAMTTFFPRQHPPVVFFYQCLQAEGALSASGRLPRKRPTHVARAPYRTPQQMVLTSRCARCGFEIGGEATMRAIAAFTEATVEAQRRKKRKKQPILHPYKLVLAVLYGENVRKPAQAAPAKGPASGKSKSPSKKDKKKRNRKKKPQKGQAASDAQTVVADADVPSPSPLFHLMTNKEAPAQGPSEKQEVDPTDMHTVCPRCHNLSAHAQLRVTCQDPPSDVISASSAKEMVNIFRSAPPDQDQGKESHVKVLTPVSLRDAFAAKRKFYMQLQQQKRKAALAATASKDADKGDASKTTVSLRQLSVLQWIRCESTLFWNVFWLFGVLDLPYAFLFDDDLSADTFALDLPAVTGRRGSASLSSSPSSAAVPRPALVDQPRLDSDSKAITAPAVIKPSDSADKAEVCMLPRYTLRSSIGSEWIIAPDETKATPRTELPVQTEAKQPAPIPKALTTSLSKANALVEAGTGTGTTPSTSVSASPSADSLASLSSTSSVSSSGSELSEDDVRAPPSSSARSQAAAAAAAPPPQTMEEKQKERTHEQQKSKLHAHTPGLPSYLKKLALLRARLSNRGSTVERTLSTLEEIRVLLTQRFVDDSNPSKPLASTAVHTNMQHLGIEPHLSRSGYLLLAALADVLRQHAYTHSSSRNKRSSATGSHRVVASTIKLLCILSGVEAEYSLFRNKSEPASALKKHSLGAMDARDSLSSDIAPSSKHKGMRAGAMGIDTHNNRTMNQEYQQSKANLERVNSGDSTDDRKDRLPRNEADSEALINLVTVVVGVLSLYMSSPLVVQAGALVLTNQLLVVSLPRHQKSRVKLFLKCSGMNVCISALRRHADAPGVLDMVCYLLSVVTQYDPDNTIPLLMETPSSGKGHSSGSAGGIALVARALTRGSRWNHLDLVGGATRLFHNAAGHCRPEDIERLLHLNVFKVFLDTLYKFVYAPDRARSQLHVDVVRQTLLALDAFARSSSLVTNLTDGGAIKALGSLLSHDVNVIEAPASSNATHTKRNSEMMGPNQRALQLYEQTHHDMSPSPRGPRGQNVAQLQIDSGALAVMARMLSFTAPKLIKRVGALISVEEGIDTALSSITPLVALHRQELLNEYKIVKARDDERAAADAKKPATDPSTGVSVPSTGGHARRATLAASGTQFQGRVGSPRAASLLLAADSLDSAHRDAIAAAVNFASHFSASVNTDMLVGASRTPIKVLQVVCRLLVEVLRAHRKLDNEDGDPDMSPNVHLVCYSLLPHVYTDLVSHAIIGITNLIGALDLVLTEPVESDADTVDGISSSSLHSIADTTLPKSLKGRRRAGRRASLSTLTLSGSTRQLVPAPPQKPKPSEEQKGLSDSKDSDNTKTNEDSDNDDGDDDDDDSGRPRVEVVDAALLTRPDMHPRTMSTAAASLEEMGSALTAGTSSVSAVTSPTPGPLSPTSASPVMGDKADVDKGRSRRMGSSDSAGSVRAIHPSSSSNLLQVQSQFLELKAEAIATVDDLHSISYEVLFENADPEVDLSAPEIKFRRALLFFARALRPISAVTSPSSGPLSPSKTSSSLQAMSPLRVPDALSDVASDRIIISPANAMASLGMLSDTVLPNHTPRSPVNSNGPLPVESPDNSGTPRFSPWRKINLNKVLSLKRGKSKKKLERLTVVRDKSVPLLHSPKGGSPHSPHSPHLRQEPLNTDGFSPPPPRSRGQSLSTGRTSDDTAPSSASSDDVKERPIVDRAASAHATLARHSSLASASSSSSGALGPNPTVAELEKRWHSLLKAADKANEGRAAFLQRSKTARSLVKHGIPRRYRFRVWSCLIGADRKRQQYAVDYYDRLALSYEEHGSASQGEITQDLHRTLPNVPMFQTDAGRARLARVLGAYSLLDPDVVGYCQSMNIVGGTLLMLLSEEHAFWILAALMRKYVGYYTKTMCQLMVDQRVLEDLFSFSQPELCDHLSASDIKVSMFSVSWFLCLFAEAPLPIDNISLLWDYLFFYGDEILFHTALSILRMRKPEIMELSGMPDILTFCLHDGIRTGLNAKSVIRSFELQRGFRERMETLRRYHRTQVLSENTTVDGGFAMSLVKQYGFSSEQEIQRLWQHFLSPSPWDILQTSSIDSVLPFHQAFCPLVFSAAHRRRWRDHGLFCGVFHRLYSVLDQYDTGRVSLTDFVRGVAIFNKAKVEERAKLCFEFFDVDSSGIVDRMEVAKALGMLHEMYHGNTPEREAKSAKMTDELFEAAHQVLSDKLAHSAFVQVIHHNVYARVFFKLCSDETVEKTLNQLCR